MDRSEHVDLMAALAGSTAGTNTSQNRISGRALRLAGVQACQAARRRSVDAAQPHHVQTVDLDTAAKIQLPNPE